MKDPRQAHASRVAGVILSGGRGRRLGDVDKGLIGIGGQPLVARIAAQLAPQVDELLISANRNIDQYRRLGYPVVTDPIAGYAGPLAGILGALSHCRSTYLLTVPGDAPTICPQYAARMLRALPKSAPAACVARSGDRMQPMYLLLDTTLLESLRAYMDAGGRKTADWVESIHARTVEFPDCPEQFFNVNEPADQRLLAELTGDQQ